MKVEIGRAIRHCACKCLVVIMTVVVAVSNATISVYAVEDTSKSDDMRWTIDDFYSANNINYYSENEGCDSSIAGGGIDGATAIGQTTSNGEALFKFLISNNFSALGNKPMSAIQAAAVVGNVHWESGGVNPGSEESNGIGLGIVQWSYNRRTKLENYAKEHGKPATDLGIQFDFLKQELETTEKGSISSDNFLNSKDLNVVTQQFMQDFERPGIPHLAERQKLAKMYYDKYKDMAPDDNKDDNCESESANVNGGTIVQVAKEMAEWGAKYNACYDSSGVSHQKDEKWYDKAIENHFAGEYAVDCSSFVMAVIYKATGHLYHFNTVSMCADTNNFKTVTDPKPGDFAITCSTHVEIVTEVQNGEVTKTVGSHEAGCGAGYGPSPASGGAYKGEKYLRYIGPGSSDK